MTLDMIVSEKNKWKEMPGVLVPWLQDYDPFVEGAKLLKDDTLRATGADLRDVIPYLERAHDEYGQLFKYAKVADTVDRITSIAGAGIEAATMWLGLGIPANVIEEGIEIAAKLPFYVTLCKDPNQRTRAALLFMEELATSAIPVGGDVWDIVTNRYITTANKVIAESARDAYLADYASKQE